ncbi:glycosyl transferase family protein [Oceanicaulis sp. HTCC2633]|nr:glycosyltransferase family 2 protein [Oceanicaulis sp. HTCC2633]EAP90047.1 glycosyl transferase family protein [Oceanicaulis sp. HTCC2633]
MTDPVADIAVLIVAFQSQGTLPGVIAGLERQTVRPCSIHVLENGSPSEARINAGMVGAAAELVESEANLGFAAGNNFLARRTEAQWLFLLNPDAYPEPDLIAQLQAAITRYPGVRLFGCTQLADGAPGVLDGAGDVYHMTGLPYRSGYGAHIDPPPDGEVFGPCGAALLIRRDLFKALSGFDEDYFCYVEDVDLAYRARLLGERCIQLNKARVRHVGYASSGRRSAFASYHGVRNRLWTFLKNTPWPLLVLLTPVHAGVTVLLWLSAARFGQFTLFGRAIRDSLAAWPTLMAKRRAVQSQRRASALSIARAMTWNPLKLLTRGLDVRPLHDAMQSRATPKPPQ